jgi:hypothetical protein
VGADLLRIQRQVILPVRPVVDISTLLAVLHDVLVGSLVNGLDLVTTEDNGLDRPIRAHDVVDLGSDGSDDAKIVASSLHAPPQVGLGVNGLQITIRQNYIHREELIGNEAVVTLKPAMATSKSRSKVAHAFTCTSH